MDILWHAERYRLSIEQTARAGVSLAQAQKLMRHSTPALAANIYTRLQMDDARDAVAKIDVGGKKMRRPAPARRRRAAGE